MPTESVIPGDLKRRAEPRDFLLRAILYLLRRKRRELERRIEVGWDAKLSSDLDCLLSAQELLSAVGRSSEDIESAN